MGTSMNLNEHILILFQTLILLSLYTYVAYRVLRVKELLTHYKRAYSLMGAKSGDSRRTKVLEEALVTGIIRDQTNPILASGIDYALNILEQEAGIEVEPRDLLLLLNSPQIQELIGPYMQKISQNIEHTVNSTQKEMKGGQYVLKNYR